MRCEQAREQIGPYVDGQLAPSERLRLEEHAGTCPHCSCEMRSLKELTNAVCDCEPTCPPSELWTAIENRLDGRKRTGLRLRVQRMAGIAAALLFAVLAGYVLVNRGPDFATPVQAATVDFTLLLDNLNSDPRAAFDRFLARYHAKPVSADAARTHAPKLNFDIPATLPGGFRREAIYKLDFGGSPGVAARYERDGELLGALFHQPVLKEDFGTHRDYDCIVGQHRGHSVAVGDWQLVHLTDATTCHCVLSRLDPDAQLPAVMAVLAPGSHRAEKDPHDHEGEAP